MTQNPKNILKDINGLEWILSAFRKVFVFENDFNILIMHCP